MSTYRVGHHQPQNVYRESDDDPCPASVDGRCAESGEIHPKCKPGQCRYDQTDARTTLPATRTQTSYLGIWQAPEPYDELVHVFSDDATRADLARAGWRKATDGD